MKKFLLLIFFFITSCSQSSIQNDFSVNNDMSIDEYKIKLEEYAKNNSYPKIDE